MSTHDEAAAPCEHLNCTIREYSDAVMRYERVAGQQTTVTDDGSECIQVHVVCADCGLDELYPAPSNPACPGWLKEVIHQAICFLMDEMRKNGIEPQ